MAISVSRRSNKGGQLPENECLERNDHDDPCQICNLCAALIKTKNASDEQGVKMMLKSHQVLQDLYYKVEIEIGKRGAWMSSLIVLDTSAGPNLTIKKFIMTERTRSIKTVKVECLR